MFIFHASFMCRFQIILQCLLIIADSAAVLTHLLCPLEKTPFRLSSVLLVILMLIKHHRQCTWNTRTGNRKQNLLFVFLSLSRSLTLESTLVNLSLSNQPDRMDTILLLYPQPFSCRSSIWLIPVLGAWKQRLTQWLSWWQRARQECGNTVMIKRFWMVPQ